MIRFWTKYKETPENALVVTPRLFCRKSWRGWGLWGWWGRVVPCQWPHPVLPPPGGQQGNQQASDAQSSTPRRAGGESSGSRVWWTDTKALRREFGGRQRRRQLVERGNKQKWQRNSRLQQVSSISPFQKFLLCLIDHFLLFNFRFYPSRDPFQNPKC